MFSLKMTQSDLLSLRIEPLDYDVISDSIRGIA